MTASECRCSGPSSLREKDTQRNQGPEDDGNRNSTRGGRRDTETRRDLRWDNPQGTTGTWVQDKGGNGGANEMGYNGRRRHAAQGADIAAEAGRRWGVGVNVRCYDNNRY